MYSKEYPLILEAILSWTSLLGSSRICFNVPAKLFYKHKFAKILSFLQVLVIAAYIFYLGIRSIDSKLSRDLANEFPLCYSAFLIHLVVIGSYLMQYGTLSNVTMAVSMTQLYRYSLRFRRKWVTPSYSIRTSLCGRFMEVLVFLAVWLFNVVLPWIVAMHYWFFPDTIIYIATWVPTPWRYHQGFRILFTMCVVGYMYAFGNAVFQPIIYLTMNFSVFVIHGELRVSKKRRYITRDELRRSSHLIKEYRQLDVLQRNMNDLTGPLLIPCNALVMQFLVFAIYTLIRHRNERDVAATLILVNAFIGFAVFWSLVLEIAGRHHELDKKVLKSWKMAAFESKFDAKYMMKIRKGMRPFAFGIYGTFIIKRLTILKFFRRVIGGTFRALVALQKRNRF